MLNCVRSVRGLALVQVWILLHSVTALPLQEPKEEKNELFDRDIKIPFEKPENQLSTPEINKGSDVFLIDGDILPNPLTKTVLLGENYRWPRKVPYYLNDDLEINAKGVILKAFERLRLKSCIDFKPWSGEKNYINVIRGNGCYSYVGNLQRGGQDLSIGTGCDTVEKVQHEFLHALGFYHEHTRSDRDDYVTIAWENVQTGQESIFHSYPDTEITSVGVPYDYISLMHYHNEAFSTGGQTIIAKNARYSDIMGKPLDLTAKDTLKLNRVYNCTSSLTFLDLCDFESDEVCAMLQRTDDNSDWLWLTQVPGGPSADHTYVENGRGYFMHFNTQFGKSGDTAVLESRLFYPARGYQCLEFFYYHSGSASDQLNIWIKQYTPAHPNGTLTLMESLQGNPANYWQLHYTSLNATNKFRFVFQGVKGSGSSSGGISIDDINLSETECPHHVWHIRHFSQDLLKKGINSPPFYSKDGYAFMLQLSTYPTESSPDNFAAFLYLISGANDKQLQWPCLWKQVTMEFLDQDVNLQQRISSMKSITTDMRTSSDGKYVWDNPAVVGKWFMTFPNGTRFNATGGAGYFFFRTAEWLQRKDFLKGGDAFILISIEDISHLSPNLPKPTYQSLTSPSQSTSLNKRKLGTNIYYTGENGFANILMEMCRCIVTEVCTTPLFTTLLILVLIST